MIRLLLSLVFFSLTFTLLPAQEDFKVIGYLPYYRFNYANQIEFDKITHLNIAFANPDLEGNLDVGGQDIDPIVQRARSFDVPVFISLAGGALLPEWEEAWEHLMLPANRSAFIHKIVEYVYDHDLDGVDVDLEWSHVNFKYSPFVLELRDSMDAHDITMTAALPGTYRYPEITDEAMHAYDWINMMSYDLRGPWNPSDPGPHSPYSFAVSSINYWVGQGMPEEKLTLGVPFYGYDFSNTPVTAFTYRTIVDQNPANAMADQVGLAYYNGIPTIQQKTELAMDRLSGIMIWELGQDSYTEFSLLRAIDELVNPSTSTSEEVAADYLKVYPNPFGGQLTIHSESSEELEVQLTDLSGKILKQFRIDAGGRQEMSTGWLQAGFYVLRVAGDSGQQTYKLVKH